MRPVEFEAVDGTELIGDLARPEHSRAGAIVCHPHPQFGGNRFNHVVGAVFDALPAADIAALRFDFRREYGDGIAEVEDARAAVDALADAVPDVPLLAIGYSFGGVVTLALRDDRLSAKVLIAPPLGISGQSPVAHLPTLVHVPSNDQFCPPEVAEPTIAEWDDAEMRIVERADHFLNGHAGAIALDTLLWIDELLAGRP